MSASKGKNKCSECHHFQYSHRLSSEGGCRMCKCHRWHGPLEKAVKMSTAAYRERLAPVTPGAMCWEASLAAFGITVAHDESYRTPSWIHQRMNDNGWLLRLVKPSEIVPDVDDDSEDGLTLAVVMPHVTHGDWLLLTDRHVIAVRDDFVTDTMGEEKTVKRQVWRAYEVKAESVKPPVKCNCLDPAVFGHAPGHRQPRGFRGQL